MIEWSGDRGVRLWMNEYHGTEVQTINSGVNHGGFFKEEWGTPAYQVHLTVC